MTHPRKVIRDSVTAAIVAAETLASERVYPSREAPIDVETTLINEGPVILVYTRRDRLAEGGYPASGFGQVRRVCDLFVEVTAAGALALEDKLDTMAEEVEGILNNFAVPGQPATEILHIETDIESTSEFETPLGGALLQYEAKYWANWRNDPDEEGDVFPCGAEAFVRVNGGPPEPIDLAGCADCDS